MTCSGLYPERDVDLTISKINKKNKLWKCGN